MTLLIFLYGAIIGSFLNVCIYRIPIEESIAFPASHCPNCHTSLKWYDNIPIISYLSLKGKCRYCREKISLQYPIVEFLNASLYVIMYFKFGFSLEFIYYALISSVLIIITFIDIREMIIPDSLVVTLLILALIYKFANYVLGQPLKIRESIIGLLFAGGLFLAIVLITKGGMGGGDVTLISALGFILGFKKIILNIFLSFILGAIISLFLLATKIKTRKDPIPFGPFIVLAFFITVLWGSEIIDLYFQTLFF